MVRKAVIVLLLGLCPSLFSMQQASLTTLPLDIVKKVLVYLIHSETQNIQSPHSLKTELAQLAQQSNPNQILFLKKELAYKKIQAEIAQAGGELERYVKKLLTTIISIPLINHRFANFFKNKDFIQWFITALAQELQSELWLPLETAQVIAAKTLRTALSIEWIIENSKEKEWIRLEAEKIDLQGLIPPQPVKPTFVEQAKNLLGYLNLASIPFYTFTAIQNLFSNQKPKSLKPLFLSPEVQNHYEAFLKEMLAIERRIKAGNTKATYNNLLLWGPPATGKTFLTKHVADNYGFEYICLDTHELENISFQEAKEKITSFFTRAQQSSKKLIHITDTALLFHCKNDINNYYSRLPFLHSQPNGSNAIKTLFFEYMKKQSNNYIIVIELCLYSFHEFKLEKDIKDMVAEVIVFQTPDLKQRSNFLKYCRDKLLVKIQDPLPLKVSISLLLDDKKLEEIALRFPQASYIDLAHIIQDIKLHASTYDKLYSEIIEQAILRALRKQKEHTIPKDTF